MKLVPSALLALSFSLLTSCAAMFTGTKGEVLFSATPAEGTSVHVGDDVYPIDEVPRKIKKSTKQVVFSHPTHGDYVVPVKRNFQAGFLLMDILFTPGYGLVGVLVDGGTNAWYKLPSTVQFDFTSEIAKQSTDADSNGSKIARASAEEVEEVLGRRTANAVPASATTPSTALAGP